jgi:L,D-peptidoglycan transpeptidase YkuD (ErfK/YbiS/YcfS/YnhG family)
VKTTIALSACLALLAAVSAGGGQARLADCPPTLANELTSTGSGTQLVTVVAAARASTRGALQLWRKQGECWSAVAGPWPAWLGRRGTSPHKREGDRTTPAGTFGFVRTMFGG